MDTINSWQGTPGLAPDEVVYLLENDFEQIGQMRAAAKSILQRFENMKHAIISTEMRDAAFRGVSTAAGQEREAYASDAYLNWAEGHAKALEEYENWDWQYWRLKHRIDLFLNEQANERARMKLW